MSKPDNYVSGLANIKLVRAGVRARVSPGWLGEGREGTLLGTPVRVDQWWVVVKFDDEEDPNVHKLAGLSVSKEPAPGSALRAVEGRCGGCGAAVPLNQLEMGRCGLCI